MIEPKEYYLEKERLKDLDSYSIVDSIPETDYDNLTAIAAQICGTPISLISIIDSTRQWFKSHHGIDVSETPREHAFCAHALNDPNKVFVVQDARTDKRFHDNPLVTGDPHVIFYAGVPLVSEIGMPLGTLCVIDHKPHLLNPGQLKSLIALSKQVMNLMELRKNKIRLEELLENLEEKNREIEGFAFMAAHDLKSPLISISDMTKLFKEDYRSKIDQEGLNMLGMIERSADKLRRLTQGLLEYSRSEKVLKEKKSWIVMETLIEEIKDLFGSETELVIDLKSNLKEIYVNRTAINQIMINLIANAIKYNDKKTIEINVGLSENETHYEFFVEDNGPGIALAYQEKIFMIFEILGKEDRFGRTGNGIGLALVRKLVEKIGGSIEVDSDLEKGSKFIFTIEK